MFFCCMNNCSFQHSYIATMSNMGNNAQGSNKPLSFVTSHTNPSSNLMQPTVYKFSTAIAKTGNLDEEYFVNLTAYAKLHEKHTRMIEETNALSDSSQRIKELESKNMHLQEMNDELRQTLLHFIKTSTTNELNNKDDAYFQNLILEKYPLPTQCSNK